MSTLSIPHGYALHDLQYTVLAGKYESDGERNIKFISEPFLSLEEAQNVAQFYCNYPFCEIQLSAVVAAE